MVMNRTVFMGFCSEKINYKYVFIMCVFLYAKYK